MKISMGQLRKLLSEGTILRLLNEDDSAAHESGASGDSIDSQVDRYLSEYESSAKIDDAVPEASVDQMESLDWRDLVKGRVINEAEDDPEDPAPGADALTGADQRPGLDKINIESFGNDIARLIQNFESLLEVRSTLLRRASKFLEKNYSDEVVQAFEDTMRDDHAMEAGTSTLDMDADKFQAPAADRANGSAAPAGGGAPV